MKKCDVCGKETNTTVCCSTCGAVSFAYCTECLKEGREPYSALVGMGIYSADLHEIFKQDVLFPSLKFQNKTVEEFDADVRKLNESYDQWVKGN